MSRIATIDPLADKLRSDGVEAVRHRPFAPVQGGFAQADKTFNEKSRMKLQHVCGETRIDQNSIAWIVCATPLPRHI